MSTKTQETSMGFSTILENNQNEMTRIDKFKNDKISIGPRNVMFAGLALGGTALIGMIGASIITGVVAIGVTVIGGGVLYYGIRVMKRMDPVIKQKLKNKAIELMISEARENAIYQLDNKVLDNHKELESARAARSKIQGQIATMESAIDPANKGKPMHTKKTETVATLKVALSKIKKNVDLRAVYNQDFEAKVKDYKDMEAFAQMASEVMDALNTSGGDKLQDMLSLEAFNQIEGDFNTALADIENGANDFEIDNG